MRPKLSLLTVWPFVMTAAIVGCQVAPTVTKVTRRPELYRVLEKTQKPIEVQPNTVLLDTRSSFDYGLNHVLNSHLFPWWNLAEQAKTGEVIRDLKQASLRLSLLGLTPTTSLIIVGYGRQGQGEEGRLAWTLVLLGYQDVQTAAVETFRKNMTSDPTPPPLNVESVPLSRREGFEIDRESYLDLLKRPFEQDPTKVIDVRSPQEYLRQSTKLLPAANRVVNIEWKEFYTENGRPDVRMIEKLKAIGVSQETPIVLVSERGVRSAAAAYALMAMGFQKVRNFTAGHRSLTSK